MLTALLALAVVYLVSFSAKCSLLGRRRTRVLGVCAIAVSLASGGLIIAAATAGPGAVEA